MEISVEKIQMDVEIVEGQVSISQAQQLDLFEPEEIARPDYNIGKYATTLFASPYRKDLTERRRIEWITNRPDGKDGEAMAAIEITPLKDQIVPTTTTFKVYMAIIQIWKVQGSSPTGNVQFSARQLAEVAGWPYSSAISRRVKSHLEILQGTNFDWILAFTRKNEDSKGHALERQVNKMKLLDEITYIERKNTFDQEAFARNHIVRINPRVVRNMLDNHVRPINHDTLRQISNDASTRLYIILDMYMATKRKWERRAHGLITDDLGYEGKRYDNRGHRKALLEKLVEDLDGKDLTSGRLHLEIRETKDKRDWKLTVFKEARVKKKRPYVPKIVSEKEASLIADDLLDLFPRAWQPKRGYMVFLCERYPEHILRDAVSRAKVDYQGNVNKSLGAIFTYELEQQVRGRRDLVWFKDVKIEG